MSNNFKELTKNTSILGLARIVEFIVGLLKIKLCAVILGATGIGIFNQLNFLSNKMSTFTLLSTGEALVKQIAESIDAENSNKLLLAALKSYILLVTVFMIASLAVLYALSETITLYVFGDIKYFQVFLVAVVSLPLLIVNSIPYSIMRAMKDIKTIAISRVVSVIINILHTLPLIYFWSLEGAVVSVFLSHLVSLFINVLYAKKLYFSRFNITFLSIIKADLLDKYVKELIRFSGFGLSIGLYVIVSEFVCRAIVVSYLGVDAIGLYSPIIMWSSLFTGFLIPALTTHLYSSLCQTKKNSEISNLLNDGLRLATLGLLPLLFLAIPFREFIITLFYSLEFIAVEKYLPYHFIGVVFQVWFSVLSSSMTSTGRIKQHGVFRFLFLSLDILITYVCVIQWGLYGWMLKHIISPVIFYFVYVFYCKKNMGLNFCNNNIAVMLYLFYGSLFLILVDEIVTFGYIANYFIGPLMLLCSGFFLRDFEKDALLFRANNVINRIKRN
jgi:O-antigen/teichoic acid export membrane protein